MKSTKKAPVVQLDGLLDICVDAVLIAWSVRAVHDSSVPYGGEPEASLKSLDRVRLSTFP